MHGGIWLFAALVVSEGRGNKEPPLLIVVLFDHVDQNVSDGERNIDYRLQAFVVCRHGGAGVKLPGAAELGREINKLRYSYARKRARETK
jgi:hypothetical protein